MSYSTLLVLCSCLCSHLLQGPSCNKHLDTRKGGERCHPSRPGPVCILFLRSETTKWGEQASKISQRPTWQSLGYQGQQPIVLVIPPGHSVLCNKWSHPWQTGSASSALDKPLNKSISNNCSFLPYSILFPPPHLHNALQIYFEEILQASDLCCTYSSGFCLCRWP